jgi:hypothetical protein
MFEFIVMAESQQLHMDILLVCDSLRIHMEIPNNTFSNFWCVRHHEISLRSGVSVFFLMKLHAHFPFRFIGLRFATTISLTTLVINQRCCCSYGE